MSITFTYLRQPLNRYTFKAPKTKAWVEEQCKGKYVLNLFAGPTRLMGCIEVANDIDPDVPCTLFQDGCPGLRQTSQGKRRVIRCYFA